MGWVVIEPRNVVWSHPDDGPSASVVRKATVADWGRQEQIREREQEALKLARDKARNLGLAMKIIDMHYTSDRSRLIVTFGAEGRVDFRPLLHELGSALDCRVELRQVGDRDVAKLTGGLGRCGRVLC